MHARAPAPPSPRPRVRISSSWKCAEKKVVEVGSPTLAEPTAKPRSRNWPKGQNPANTHKSMNLRPSVDDRNKGHPQTTTGHPWTNAGIPQTTLEQSASRRPRGASARRRPQGHPHADGHVVSNDCQHCRPLMFVRGKMFATSETSWTATAQRTSLTGQPTIFGRTWSWSQ